MSEAEQRVAVVAKGLLRKFKWKESVVEKGVDARTHFGIIAQDLQDAFEKKLDVKTKRDHDRHHNNKKLK